MHNLAEHHKPQNLSDKFAFYVCKFFHAIVNFYFQDRYIHRALFLETIAAVPGIVAAIFVHLKSLRKIQSYEKPLQALIDESTNERMHLLTFNKIIKPTKFENFLIYSAQWFFITFYFILYLISSKTAHRMLGYFEEEAINSYSQYLEEIKKGTIPNLPAPQIAIDYWHLPEQAKLYEVIEAIRKDEINHRNMNHNFANSEEK